MSIELINVRGTYRRAMALVALMTIIVIASTQTRADTGTCGGQMISLPFTDVPASNVFFCSIAEAYFSALTNGTTATTYSPSANVPREQMAAFITRTLDQSLKRGSKKAALDQFWTTQGENNLGLTTLEISPSGVKPDGADLWVANQGSNTVSRVRASDARLLETWTGATTCFGVLVAMGKVFVTGDTSPGKLYQIDPTQTAGAVTTLSSSLGAFPLGIAFDGQRIWTANSGTPGSVSIITVNPTTVTTVTTGFSHPRAILYDGANIWVTDTGDFKLKKLNSSGAILQSVDVGGFPDFPAFDGTNIWVPNNLSNTVSVVRASTGVVLATLSGNGLNQPFEAAFDGERILVTNVIGGSVSLWKATDLTPIGTFSTGAGTNPLGVASDGLNFWITIDGNPGKLARF
jgi:DNA-binding beta-propeller fold protein YncE